MPMNAADPEILLLHPNRPDVFDQVVERGLKQSSPIMIATKPQATVSGASLASIAFQVILPDGTEALAQAVTTVALLAQAGFVFQGIRDAEHRPAGPVH